jgi:hypothetical protein
VVSWTHGCEETGIRERRRSNREGRDNSVSPENPSSGELIAPAMLRAPAFSFARGSGSANAGTMTIAKGAGPSSRSFLMAREFSMRAPRVASAKNDGFAVSVSRISRTTSDGR